MDSVDIFAVVVIYFLGVATGVFHGTPVKPVVMTLAAALIVVVSVCGA